MNDLTEIIAVTFSEGAPWWILWFALIGPLVGLIISILLRFDEEGVSIGYGAIAAVIFVGLASLTFVMQDSERTRSLTELELTKIGYSQVEVGPNMDRFDAVKDDTWTKGLLEFIRQEGGTKYYQVILVPPIQAPPGE